MNNNVSLLYLLDSRSVYIVYKEKRDSSERALGTIDLSLIDI